MNWFYAKDGKQSGPVAFSEIERLFAEGQLNGESLVWQQGTPTWVKLSTILPPAPAETVLPPAPPLVPEVVVAPAAPTTPSPVPSTLPDYGDFLCYGIIAALIPCVGIFAYIAAVVLLLIEYFGIRKAVREGTLTANTYSEANPVLFVAGLICCSTLLYPLYMHLRNKSGYFKPQPRAVTIAIIVLVISILLGLGGFYFNYTAQAMAHHQ